MRNEASFAPLLQSFFTGRLMQQKQASPHTICSYRDTFRLLLRFLEKKLRKPPSRLVLDEVGAPLIVAFLDELEEERKISPRSRNLRLTAIRSFFRYLAFEVPTHSGQIQRVLAIPGKRFSQALVGFLSRPEAEALLRAPSSATWSGRRDHALMLLALQTGLRLSELTGLRRDDLSLTDWSPCKSGGQGAERAMYAPRQTDRSCPERMVEGACAWLCESRLHERTRRPIEPRRRSVHRSEARGGSFSELFHTRDKACDPTRFSSYSRDGVASCWCRSNSDRVVAGPRVYRDHADLPGRQSGYERRSLGKDPPDR